MYFVTQKPYEAKCAMREAPMLLELLCNEVIELLNNQKLTENDLRPQGQ